VVLKEIIDIDVVNKTVTYKVFTWGEIKTIKNSFNSFEDSYYGYVKGK